MIGGAGTSKTWKQVGQVTGQVSTIQTTESGEFAKENSQERVRPGDVFSPEPGARSPEPGARSPEPGARRLAAGGWRGKSRLAFPRLRRYHPAMPARLVIFLAAFLVFPLWLGPSAAATEWSLEPDASRTFVFPDAPPSLWREALGIEKATAATVLLPTDYTEDRDFPLLLLIGGAQGNHGHEADWIRQYVGDTGIICVSIPLFIRELAPMEEDESNRWIRLYLGPEESAWIWRAWRPMLETVFAAIPNIDRSKCFIGGFSNGANATAIVLDNPETGPELRDYFGHFVLIEGGKEISARPAFDGLSFLVCEGALKAGRFQPIATGLSRIPGVAVNFHQMPGVGHAVPDHEKRWVGNWIRAKCALPALDPIRPEEGVVTDDFEGR